MSAETAWLALRLEGPLQSWGFDSEYSRRGTGLMPTKSGIAGMCCAALGHSRGSETEREFLKEFSMLKMTAISGARAQRRQTRQIRRLEDYHTVQNTLKAAGGTKLSHITHRQYLNDAAFGVLLEGPDNLVREIGDAMVDPRWGIWLGRKSCLPSAPVLAGVFDDKANALGALIGDESLESFTRQEEVENFTDGKDSLSDQAISFLSTQREFAPRRVRTIQGK